ncbi:hypothetical protein BS78_04G092300 [Paspalum vaginatum]|nr:hypothetical protein BS78_04G092300 [Paspalum vaginatum]
MAAAAALQQRLFLTASTSTSSTASSSAATRPRRSTAAPCRAALRVPNGRLQAAAAAGLALEWVDAAAAVAPPTTADGTAAERLRLVAEAAADRAEMHDIIGRQRDNWNHLLLHSTNSLALAASALAALAPGGAPAAASAGALLATAAVTMAAVNTVQPSQLAEEQRNATRLWRQLERDARAALEHRVVVGEADVEAAVDRVLALDAAYPLPLLPGMLEKFPKEVEPARWWPRRRPHSPPAQQQQQMTMAKRRSRSFGARRGGNGWSEEVEEEMRGLLRVLRAKDEHQYLAAGKLVLRANRALAVAGPALAGAGAVAAAAASIGAGGSWASGAAVACGALAAAANTVEHGGQLGMLFELLRNCAGFYRKVQEDIEAALGEPDAERRENGDVFRTRVALLLGRSVSELRQFRRVASPSVGDDDIKDYAGKLF